MAAALTDFQGSFTSAPSLTAEKWYLLPKYIEDTYIFPIYKKYMHFFQIDFHTRLCFNMTSPTLSDGQFCRFCYKEVVWWRNTLEGLILISHSIALTRSISVETKVKLLSAVINCAPCNLNFKTSARTNLKSSASAVMGHFQLYYVINEEQLTVMSMTTTITFHYII